MPVRPVRPVEEPASPHPPTHTPRASMLLLVALALVWGVHWVVAKKGLEYMPPFTFAALRTGVGLAAVVATLALRGGLALPPRRDIPVVLSVGLGQVAAGTALMNVALMVVPAGRSSILVYTMPIWVVLMQVVFLRMQPLPTEVMGLLLGAAGIVALVNPASIDWSAPGELRGVLLLLLSAAIWGATSIHVRRHRWTSPPLALQPWQLLVAFVPLAAIAVVLEPAGEIRWEPATIGVLLYSGVLATAFAFWASQSITRSLGPLAATVGFLGVPVVGLAAGALLLGETLSIVDLLGFALTAGGILLVTRPRATPGGRPSSGVSGPAVPEAALQSPSTAE